MATVPRLQRYYQGATTSCPRVAFGSLVSPAGSTGACRGSCSPWALPPPCRPGDGPGSGFHAGNPPSSVIARGQVQDLPGSLAIHPVTLRQSTTPDDPLRLANGGASGAAPTRKTMRASSSQTEFEAYSAASSPAVYASRRALPHAMQDSLPAGWLRLCRAGVEPAGPRREVSAHDILLSRAYPGAMFVRSSGDAIAAPARISSSAQSRAAGLRGL